MTDDQKLFFELAKEYEATKESLDATRQAMEDVMKRLGLDTFHQDSSTGLVYQIAHPTGTFIYFREIDYIRTKKEGEKSGTLSVKKAQEAGFIV